MLKRANLERGKTQENPENAIDDYSMNTTLLLVSTVKVIQENNVRINSHDNILMNSIVVHIIQLRNKNTNTIFPQDNNSLISLSTIQISVLQKQNLFLHYCTI